ncbi:MAG: hypothetical protein WDZ41_04580 [Candidatus Babeliales bacterium]
MIKKSFAIIALLISPCIKSMPIKLEPHLHSIVKFEQEPPTIEYSLFFNDNIEVVNQKKLALIPQPKYSNLWNNLSNKQDVAKRILKSEFQKLQENLNMDQFPITCTFLIESDNSAHSNADKNILPSKYFQNMEKTLALEIDKNIKNEPRLSAIPQKINEKIDKIPLLNYIPYHMRNLFAIVSLRLASINLFQHESPLYNFMGYALSSGLILYQIFR